MTQNQESYSGRLYGAVALDRASGFVSFWLLASVLFVFTFAAFIILQYQAANSAKHTTADLQQSPVAITDGATHPPAHQQSESSPVDHGGKSGNDTGIKSMLASFFDDSEEQHHAGRDQTGSAADDQHTAWVDELYVQLNSLEPSSADADDTSLVISGRVLTRSGRPLAGIEVSAQLRRYFKTADEARFYITQQYTRAGPAMRRTRGFTNFSQAGPFPSLGIHKGYFSLRASGKASTLGEQRCKQV